jgi:hypothetical protein
MGDAMGIKHGDKFLHPSSGGPEVTALRPKEGNLNVWVFEWFFGANRVEGELRLDQLRPLGADDPVGLNDPRIYSILAGGSSRPVASRSEIQTALNTQRQELRTAPAPGRQK